MRWFIHRPMARSEMPARGNVTWVERNLCPRSSWMRNKRSRAFVESGDRVRKRGQDRRWFHSQVFMCSGIESSDAQEPALKDITVSSEALLEDVTFGLTGEGQIQYVVVAKVVPGSICEEAGLRRGQKLKKISDPIRNSEMWELSDNASLRFVRDAVRYRRAGTISLVIQDEGNSHVDLGLTLGERLEREWAQEQDARSILTASQNRIKRRKEYIEKSGQNGNGSFFAVVLGLFVVPPLLILLVAYFSGYLDTLYQGVLR